MSPKSDGTRRRWGALVVLALGLFMASLDNTILNVALPTLSRELEASTEQLQWTVDSYQVTYAGMLLVAGALVDRWGQRRTFLAGTAIFGFFSLMAGLVSTIELLILARTLMGIGAALLAPSTLALVSTLFTDPRERTQAFALWSVANGAGGAAGPLLSGVLLEHFGWGSIFLINVPIAALAIAGALWLVPAAGSRITTRHVDVFGALSSTSALALLCWAVISAPSLGVLSPLIVGVTVSGASLLAVFLWRESRADEPLLRLSLFGNRRFSVAVAVGGIVTAAGAGALFVMSQYLQFLLRYSPLETGIRVLPAAMGMLAGATIAPRSIERFGLKRTVLAGLFAAGVGFAALATLDETSTYLRMLPGIVGFGLGAGILVPAATQAVMDSLPDDATGVGSATNTALMQVGSALGVAVIGAGLQARYRDIITTSEVFLRLGDAQDRALESISGAFSAAESLPDADAGALRLAAQQGFAAGMSASMLVCVGLIAVSLVAVAAVYPTDKRAIVVEANVPGVGESPNRR